jgi:flap endonuclease-1
LKWNEPDEEGIVAYLVGEKNFNEDRVRSTVKRMKKARGQKAQGRLDAFFTVLPKDPAAVAAANAKRKVWKCSSSNL